MGQLIFIDIIRRTDFEANRDILDELGCRHIGGHSEVNGRIGVDFLRIDPTQVEGGLDFGQLNLKVVRGNDCVQMLR